MSSTHFTDQKKAIEERFIAVWGSTTPLKTENANIATPKGAEFVTLSIAAGRGRIASISATPRRRYIGVVNVRVFAPEGAGSQRTDQLIALAETAFYDTNGAGRQLASGANGLITFQTPADREVEGIAGGFFITVLRCPFYRDQQGE